MNTPQSSSSRKSFLYSSIFLRVAASIIFIPCFIIITRSGGYHFMFLVDAVIFVGMLEFYRMMESKGIKPYKFIGIVCGLALPLYVVFRNGIYSNLFLTLGLITIMCLELTRRESRLAVYHIATTVLGVIYVAFLGSHLIMLREFPLTINLDYSLGSSFVFLTFIVTWAGDTGAYVVGSALGRHPLIPRLSEKKTKEGSIGGLFFSVVGAVLAKYTLAEYLSFWQALVLGLLAGVVGQLGDLFESMIKRDVEIKDASDTIPGHGGVLDRFDSLLFTSPLISYFIKFVVFK